MLRSALVDRLAPDASSFLHMFAGNDVMEFPFAASGLTQRLERRQALTTFFAKLAEDIALDGIGQPVVHATSVSEVVRLPGPSRRGRRRVGTGGNRARSRRAKRIRHAEALPILRTLEA